MRQPERNWQDWLKRTRDGKMTQREAVERMGVSERWMCKLLRRMKKQGDAVVVHGARGRDDRSGNVAAGLPLYSCAWIRAPATRRRNALPTTSAGRVRVLKL